MSSELLPPAAVSVWFLDSQYRQSVLAELATTLDTDELRTVDEIADPGRRAEFIAAHGAVRLILSELLDVAPTALRWRHGRHGKPELAYPESELHCNLSHSGGMVALAVTRNRPVGIDVEQWRAGVEIERMAARYYTASEAEFVAAAGTESERVARFTDLWCRKEACAKAAGGRLFPALRLPAHRPDGAAADLPVVDPDGRTGPFLVRDLPAPAGFSAALAVAGTAGFDLVHRRWSPASGQITLQESNRTAVAHC
jgi:4'-phosphopantetheinyl transferase